MAQDKRPTPITNDAYGNEEQDRNRWTEGDDTTSKRSEEHSTKPDRGE